MKMKERAAREAGDRDVSDLRVGSVTAGGCVLHTGSSSRERPERDLLRAHHAMP
jgi:hypothetical protein